MKTVHLVLTSVHAAPGANEGKAGSPHAAIQEGEEADTLIE